MRLIFIAFLLYVSIISIHNQQYVYSIRYVKAFRQDLFENYMGCGKKNIVYGTYVQPKGPIDALYIYLNQGMYMNHISCNFKNMFFKMFGTDQNYKDLLMNDPKTLAERIGRTLNRGTNKFIVDWKCPLNEEFEKSRTWLNNFVGSLQTQNIDVYVKAPASYFCRTQNNFKYLVDLDKPKKYIIQMYGQQAGVYTTYQQIFQKPTQRQLPDSDKYIDLQCPKFPSYNTLSTHYSDKQFFIQKTLLKQQPGFIGPRLGKFLQKAKSTYNKFVFMDSFKEQIIQL